MTAKIYDFEKEKAIQNGELWVGVDPTDQSDWTVAETYVYKPKPESMNKEDKEKINDRP